VVRLQPNQAAQKWAQRLGAAVEDIRQGVQRVAENPAAKAAANAQKWAQEVQRAFNEGRFQAALQQVTLEEWKTAMVNKGLPRIAQGAQASTAKMERVYRDLFAYMDSGLARVKQMPDATLEQRIQRAMEWIRYMSQYKKGAGGGRA